jgi:hypothetical protein
MAELDGGSVPEAEEKIIYQRLTTPQGLPKCAKVVQDSANCGLEIPLDRPLSSSR